MIKEKAAARYLKVQPKGEGDSAFRNRQSELFMINAKISQKMCNLTSRGLLVISTSRRRTLQT